MITQLRTGARKFKKGGFTLHKAWHPKIRKNSWFVVFGILIWRGLKFCLGGLSPPKPPDGDGPFNAHESQYIGPRFFGYNSPATIAREFLKRFTDAGRLRGSI